MVEWSQPRRQLRTILRPRRLQKAPLLGVQIRPVVGPTRWSLRNRQQRRMRTRLLRRANHADRRPSPRANRVRKQRSPRANRVHRQHSPRANHVRKQRSPRANRVHRQHSPRANHARRWRSPRANRVRKQRSRRARRLHPAKSLRKSMNRPASCVERVRVMCSIAVASRSLRNIARLGEADVHGTWELLEQGTTAVT